MGNDGVKGTVASGVGWCVGLHIGIGKVVYKVNKVRVAIEIVDGHLQENGKCIDMFLPDLGRPDYRTTKCENQSGTMDLTYPCFLRARAEQALVI